MILNKGQIQMHDYLLLFSAHRRFIIHPVQCCGYLSHVPSSLHISFHRAETTCILVVCLCCLPCPVVQFHTTLHKRSLCLELPPLTLHVKNSFSSFKNHLQLLFYESLLIPSATEALLAPCLYCPLSISPLYPSAHMFYGSSCPTGNALSLLKLFKNILI